MMQKKVLLTGATGFVGRQVLRALTRAGSDVRLVVRSGSSSNLEQSATNVIQTDDLFKENRSWWSVACQGVDTVIHLAWYAESGKYIPSPRNLDCLSGTLEMAQGAAHAGIRRFIGVGSCAEYDLSEGYLSTRTPLRPATVYGAAKAATFLALSNYFAQSTIEFAWCRLFYLYGEGEDPRRLVPYLRSQLAAGKPAELSSGTQIRDYLDVAIAGERIADIASGHRTGPINICSGTAQTVRQLALSIADEYGRRDLLRFGVRPDNPFDPPCVVGLKEE